MALNYSSNRPVMTIDGMACPSPSEYKWSLQDISDKDAGRTEDGKMNKNFIGEKRKIEMKWNNIKTNDVKTILTLVHTTTSKQYFQVNFLDALTGTYVTKEMYVGDRVAPSYSTLLGLWQNLSFNLIER